MKTKSIHKAIALCFILSISTELLVQEKLPEFVMQIGHSHSVNAVAFSPTENILASGGEDNTVKLWDVATGRLLKTLEGHTNEIYTVAFSPDGRTLASGSQDHTVKLWEVGTGRLLKTLLDQVSGEVFIVAFSPDGKTLASGNAHGTVKLWDVATGLFLKILDAHFGKITTVAFSSDSKMLASGVFAYGMDEANIMLWDVATGLLLNNMTGYSQVTAVAFSPDNKTIASVSADKIVQLWETTTGRPLTTLERKSGLDDIAATVLCLWAKVWPFESWDEVVRLKNIFTPQLLVNLKGIARSFNAINVSPNGRILAFGTKNGGIISLLEVNTGKLFKNLEGQGHSDAVGAAALSFDSKILASATENSKVNLWDMASGRLIYKLEGQTERVNAVTFSPDGKILASGGRDKTVRLWDVTTGRPLKTLLGHSYPIDAIAISPDSKTLASGGFIDGTVKLWEIASGQPLNTFQMVGSNRDVRALAFFPDSKILAAGSFSTVMLWDVVAGKHLNTLEVGINSGVSTMSFSPDGNTLASGGYMVKLWDVFSGRLINTFKVHTEMAHAVAFSPDGKTLASGGKDKTVKLWDVTSGQLLKILMGHTDDVQDVSFSSNGKILISGSEDGSIRFWNVLTGETLAISYSFDTGDYLTYTPQGYYIASKGGEKFAAWRIDNKIYSFEQYSERFNRSDIVATILAGGTAPSSDIRLAVDLPPELLWINQFAQIQENRVEIILQYKGTSPLKEFDFVYNNKPVEIPRAQVPKGKQQTEIRVQLTLATNENTFFVIVRDEKDLKSWVNGTFEYTLGAKGTKNVKESASTTTTLGNYGKKYAIIVGISDYLNLPQTSKNKGDLVDLKYTANDALAFKRFLENTDLSGGQWEINSFINETATTQNVDRVLTRILSFANARDLIFVFFSGHGRSHPLREQDVYLLTYDFKPDDERSGYDYSLLRKLISDTRAEHVIAFIDACRSGTMGFSKGDQTQASFSQNILGERLAQTPANRVIFTSGRGTQLSWEDDTFKKSVFTNFLIKGLEGAAPEQKNPQFIDLGELADYVTKQVSEYTKARPNMAQQFPMLWEKSGVTYEDFPMAIRKKK